MRLPAALREIRRSRLAPVTRARGSRLSGASGLLLQGLRRPGLRRQDWLRNPLSRGSLFTMVENDTRPQIRGDRESRLRSRSGEIRSLREVPDGPLRRDSTIRGNQKTRCKRVLRGQEGRGSGAIRELHVAHVSDGLVIGQPIQNDAEPLLRGGNTIRIGEPLRELERYLIRI